MKLDETSRSSLSSINFLKSNGLPNLPKPSVDRPGGDLRPGDGGCAKSRNEYRFASGALLPGGRYFFSVVAHEVSAPPVQSAHRLWT